MTNPNKNTDVPIVTFTIEEYGRLGEVVGSLVIAQFGDGGQEEYRKVIHELFRGWLQNAAH